jgi:sortase (surface protein transpeptidase)
MSTQKRLFNGIGLVLWIFTAIFVLLPSWPHIYYRLSPQTSNVLASTIASTALAASETITNPTVTPSPDLSPSPEAPTPTPTPTLTPKIIPEVDPSLPTENGLIIDKIGVRGEIHEGEDWQAILKQGIWRVPSFDNPLENDRPIILAAHRWGYLEWSASFRKLNSFYNLPQVKVGDTIKIIWDQRPFEYKVYATETGTQITDYKANLILYTCQLWNSPVRFFVYANRVTP